MFKALTKNKTQQTDMAKTKMDRLLAAYRDEPGKADGASARKYKDIRRRDSKGNYINDYANKKKREVMEGSNKPMAADEPPGNIRPGEVYIDNKGDEIPLKNKFRKSHYMRKEDTGERIPMTSTDVDFFGHFLKQKPYERGGKPATAMSPSSYNEDVEEPNQPGRYITKPSKKNK